MLKSERLLRVSLATFAILVAPLALYIISGFHLPGRTFWQPWTPQLFPIVVLLFVYVSVYKPRFFGTFFLALLVLLYLNMSIRFFERTGHESRIFFEFAWWKRYRSTAHVLKLILPLFLFTAALLAFGLSRLRNLPRRPWWHFSLVTAYLASCAVGGFISAWMGRQTGHFSVRNDYTQPFIPLDFYKESHSIATQTIFLASILLIIGSIRGVKHPLPWGRGILLAGMAILSALLAAPYYGRPLLPAANYFWLAPFLLSGGGFIVLGLFERRSALNQKRVCTALWVLLLLSLALAILIGLLAYRNYQYRFMTMEARIGIRILSDGELSAYDQEKKFIPVPPNISEVPKGVCLPISHIAEDWLGFKMGFFSASELMQRNGEPCFRYRYQVIVCPGSKQCQDPEFKKVFPKDFSLEPLYVVRAEGDLDGDGVTSLFERSCGVDRYSQEPNCGSGIYVERDLE